MLIKKLKIADLKPAEYNPRQSTKQQEANLKESLTKFGVVEPIIVNQNAERNNIIIGGHFRVRELRKMGFKEVDCVILDLPLEDEKELNIRLNANTGAWDFDLLANNFDLEDLTTWGLEIKDIEADIEDDKESLDTLDTNSIKCPHCNKEFLLND
jgi:ParB-like chromosome segregation protein Spo0J